METHLEDHFHLSSAYRLFVPRHDRIDHMRRHELTSCKGESHVLLGIGRFAEVSVAVPRDESNQAGPRLFRVISQDTELHGKALQNSQAKYESA